MSDFKGALSVVKTLLKKRGNRLEIFRSPEPLETLPDWQNGLLFRYIRSLRTIVTSLVGKKRNTFLFLEKAFPQAMKDYKEKASKPPPITKQYKTILSDIIKEF